MKTECDVSINNTIRVWAIIATLLLLGSFWLSKLAPAQPLLMTALAVLELAALSFFMLWSRWRWQENLLKGQMEQLCGAEPSASSALDQFRQVEKTYANVRARVEEFEQEELLLCEFADHVLLVLLENGTITVANQSMWRSWGLSPSAVSGLPLQALLPNSEHDGLSSLLRRACQSKAPESAEFRILSPARPQLYIDLTVEWSQTKESFFCVAVDVSQRKMIENIKHEYAAMLTHDLRTPVAALKLTLENIQDGLEGSATSSDDTSLVSAMRALSQLSGLIGKLILLDQSESGELKLEKRMYPIAGIKDEALSLVKPLADARLISLVADVDESIVWCDRDMILQVLINILANAIRYSPERGQIKLRAQVKMQELELSLEDCGPGVPESQKTLVFERYKTVELKARPGESTGLGLAVSKAIIDAHGGKIGVRDRSGGGAAFYFTLAVASEAEIG